jgi:exodeoxyribonuclease VII small subunit
MAKKQPSFEEALKELETLADRIEHGEIGLEESIKQYEQGMKLVAHCRAILTRAEQRIERLQPGAPGDNAPGEPEDNEPSADA